jgi:hypothetical protein
VAGFISRRLLIGTGIFFVAYGLLVAGYLALKHYNQHRNLAFVLENTGYFLTNHSFTNSAGDLLLVGYETAYVLPAASVQAGNPQLLPLPVPDELSSIICYTLTPQGNLALLGETQSASQHRLACVVSPGRELLAEFELSNSLGVFSDITADADTVYVLTSGPQLSGAATTQNPAPQCVLHAFSYDGTPRWELELTPPTSQPAQNYYLGLDFYSYLVYMESGVAALSNNAVVSSVSADGELLWEHTADLALDYLATMEAGPGGLLYVLDSNNNEVLVLGEGGTLERTQPLTPQQASGGMVTPVYASVQLMQGGLAPGPDGSVVVSDYGNVYLLQADGTTQVLTGGGYGSGVLRMADGRLFVLTMGSTSVLGLMQSAHIEAFDAAGQRYARWKLPRDSESNWYSRMGIHDGPGGLLYVVMDDLVLAYTEPVPKQR